MNTELQLSSIKELESAGNTAGLTALARQLPPGDVLARVHIALSKLQEDAATSSVEYWRAYAHARRAIVVAEVGGLMWTWAQGRTAAMGTDLGLYQVAEQAATIFLQHLAYHPRAEALAPWVHFHLGRIRHAQGRHSEAAALLRQAAAADAQEISERARLFLVWCLAECGRAAQALQELPETVSFVSPGHLNAARAAVYAALGDSMCARTEALAALRSREDGAWRIYDTVQAAELMLILKRAAIQAGDFGQAAVWHQHTAALLAGWNADLIDSLLPTLPEKGGVWTDATAASSCGPAGYRRSGLLGILG
ncbi:MAG: hypothetical protein JWN15_2576 [Firmicutes bacterium]|nr:hypothetical protein [Bacillota bacterium]